MTPGARSAARLARPFLALGLAVLAFAFIEPSLNADAARTIANNAVGVAIAALGMTLVIASGGIDLSVGSVVALSSVVGALALERGWPVLGAAAAAIAAGAACGMYNGLLIAGLGLPPFIATLGTLGFFRGFAKWLSSSSPVSPDARGLNAYVSPAGWSVASPAVWMLAGAAVLAAIVLTRTVFGRHAIAIGSNPSAAAIAGVPMRRRTAQIYVLGGAMAGLAGLWQFARMTQGDPTVAIGMELKVVAAVVIGGASLSGGSASIGGAVAGALLMALLDNRCTALGWPNYVQEIVVGHIILIAVAIDRRGKPSR